MSKIKCHQCGLVNWQGATQCARCNGMLSSASYSTGLNPFENESKSSGGFSVVKIGVLVVVLGMVGLGAYQVVKPEAPKKAAASSQQIQLSPEVQKQMHEARNEQFFRDAERMEQMKKEFDAPKFDSEEMRKMMKDLPPQPQRR